MILMRAALIALLTVSPAGAEGLWDPGLTDGGWRSDYELADYGSAAWPLQFDPLCLFPGIEFAFCPGTFQALPGVMQTQPATRFARSNWHDSVTDPSGRFWVVGANTEPALHPECNSGPPNQSEAVADPLQDVYGLRLERDGFSPRPYRKQLRLALDLSHRPGQLLERPNCQTVDFVPYLGFGAASERGAGGAPLAYLQQDGPAPVLLLNAQLLDSNAQPFAADEPVPARPKGQHAGLWIEAQWSGVRHWVWLELFNSYEHADETLRAPWNWAILGSFHYPGADIVVSSAPALHRDCGAQGLQLPDPTPAAWWQGQDHAMRIDLRRLFQCLGNRFEPVLPALNQPIAITGLHMWVEVGVRELDGEPGLSVDDYDSRLMMGFDGIDLLPAGTPVLDDEDSLLRQWSEDFLGREFSAKQTAAWRWRLQNQGKVATTMYLLRSRDFQASAGIAAHLQVLAFDAVVLPQAFETHRRLLASGAVVARKLAHEIARSAEFGQRYAGLSNAEFVAAMFRSALGQDLIEHPEAAQIEAQYGSALYWSGRLDAGVVQRGELLDVALRIGLARGQRQADIDATLLYRVMLGQFPNAQALAYWREQDPFPETLIDALYFAPAYRNRFLPPAWQQR